jgi:hypothetical protein
MAVTAPLNNVIMNKRQRRSIYMPHTMFLVDRNDLAPTKFYELARFREFRDVYRIHPGWIRRTRIQSKT